MPIRVRSLEVLQDAHDAITELLEAPEIMRVLLPNPGDRDYMRGAVNALCWALVHEGGGANAFRQNLKTLKARLVDLRAAMADDTPAAAEPLVAAVDLAEETAAEATGAEPLDEVRLDLHGMIQTFVDLWGPRDKQAWPRFIPDLRMLLEAFGQAAIMHDSLPDTEHEHGEPVV